MEGRYYVAHGALMEDIGTGIRRVIECDTSDREAVKIDESFAHRIAEALNDQERRQTPS